MPATAASQIREELPSHRRRRVRAARPRRERSRLLGAALLWCCAACGYRFERHGRVIDAETSAAIVGARVRCSPEVGDTDTITGADGRFTLYYDEPCEALEVSDIDGAENALYEARTIPFPSGTAEIVVALTRTP